MEYCRVCGTRLIGDKCHKCGKNYEQKNIDIVKQRVKGHINRNYNFRIPSTPKIVAVVFIVAVVIVVSYLIFSQPASHPASSSGLANTFSSSPVQNEVSANTGGQKPALRVYHQMVNQIGGGLGCFGRVDGGVTNIGNAEAQNVVVTCVAEDVSAQKDLGSIKASDTQQFQVILNYDCQHWRTEECTVTCGNC